VFPSWEGTISALPSLASKPKPCHAKVAQRARADGRCADWRELRERIPGEWPLGLFAGVAVRRSAGVARIENWVSVPITLYRQVDSRFVGHPTKHQS